jgi:hypothetical protein
MGTGALNEAMDQWWHQPKVKKYAKYRLIEASIK